MIEIWINPACSKCRTAISGLDAAGSEYVIRRYLEDVPTATEIEDVLGRLGLEPWDITRRPDAKGLGVELPERSAEQRAAWIALLAAEPRLIQRPIITAADGTTVVGRDEDSLKRVIAADA
ncbi:ArsC/Spx/MgsR family protein [Nocardioides nematodiphilus]|uniref:ArsC/Spx/MgsR family protein n=1 Tax=Nocardioides nematodiphilus TaxID=2849669 RepID=UPI001CD97115|nr:ArsC/Spx/MgsR family protein [Nocardioides nematodiphilus]MCA1982341.1 arsenate reductase [Nocardioides nematodiphilus]